MWKRMLLVLVLLLYCQAGYASPLQDFSPGHMAIDVNWKPDSFRGGKNNWEFSGTAGLNGRWAVNYRQISFKPTYEGSKLDTNNKELNLIYKVNPSIQLYAGYSLVKGHEAGSGNDLPQKNLVQGGIIGMKSIGHGTMLFGNVGGSNHSANIEFGLSHQIQKNLEMTATYRHLEFRDIEASNLQEDFRGFGIGFTYKI